MLLILVSVSCIQRVVPSIFFPKVESNVYMEGELHGQLILEEDCLRLKHSFSDISYLLIWPPDFSVREKNAQIQVLDATGQIFVTVEDEVTLGGGEYPEKNKTDLEQRIGQAFPEACPGPYWLVAPPE